MTLSLDRLSTKSPLTQREQSTLQIEALKLDYADTRSDGGHQMAQLRFGSLETLEAVAVIVREVKQQPMIADDLDRRVRGLNPQIEHDPDDEARDDTVLVGEPARQVKRTLEQVGDGM